MFNSYRNLLDNNTYLRLFVSADTKYKMLRGVTLNLGHTIIVLTITTMRTI